MKLLRMLAVFWLTLAVSGTWGFAWVTPVAPQTPPAPPSPPPQPVSPAQPPGESVPGALALPTLKAVLLGRKRWTAGNK